MFTNFSTEPFASSPAKRVALIVVAGSFEHDFVKNQRIQKYHQPSSEKLLSLQKIL